MSQEFEKFTARAKKIFGIANQQAKKRNSPVIGTQHILLALIKQGTGIGVSILSQLGVFQKDIQIKIKAAPKVNTPVAGTLPHSTNVQNVVQRAVECAKQLSHNYVGTQHLVLGILHVPKCKACKILRDHKVDLKSFKQELTQLLDPQRGTGSAQYRQNDSTPQAEAKFIKKVNQIQDKSSTPQLDKYSRDLTAAARKGQLDTVIGRQVEIDRIINILSRRNKNNPVLIGEPGTGKSAIIEGLAHRIASGNVPQGLKVKRVISLDLACMVAGTKYRGQFQERIKNIMKQTEKAGNIILFIDEIHTIVGAGGAEGSMDAANILKPSLSRGLIQIAGATTLDEYRKHIEKDGALERRFQKIIVQPTTRQQTIDILKGLRHHYEKFHNVRLTDAAIAAAVDFSNRYICDRAQPDKSIDLIDQAGASVKVNSTRQHDNMIMQFDRLIHDLQKQKTSAVKNSDYEVAAQMRDQIEGIKKKKAKEQKSISKTAQSKGTIDQGVIAAIVAKMTGIPLKQMEKGQIEKLIDLENQLHKNIISQDEAVEQVCKSIRRARAGLKDPRRPIGSFLFVGSSGVGKTLLCKTLAKNLFGDEDALIRLDMSEYMQKHNVSRLVGAPPGYVGYDEGGQLTQKIRRRPYAVVLLDEIEKAHPDVFNTMLQVMEQGQLTDSFGRHVDFRNVVLVMTSNIGSHLIKSSANFGFTSKQAGTDHEKTKNMVMAQVERHMRPEFINRLDNIIVFKPLGKDDLTKIIDIQMAKVQQRLAQNNIEIVLSQSARQFLITNGYNPQFGARPLRRAIERNIEDLLAEQIIKGTIGNGSKINIILDSQTNKLRMEAVSSAVRQAAKVIQKK